MIVFRDLLERVFTSQLSTPPQCKPPSRPQKGQPPNQTPKPQRNVPEKRLAPLRSLKNLHPTASQIIFYFFLPIILTFEIY